MLLSMLKKLSPLCDVSGVGLDISEAALEVARSNAEKLNLVDCTTFMIGDFGKLELILNELKENGPFDIIIFYVILLYYIVVIVIALVLVIYLNGENQI